MKIVTLSDIYSSVSSVRVVCNDKAEYSFVKSNYSWSYTNLQPEPGEYFVRVVKGPRKGTIGCITSIVPTIDKKNHFHKKKASIEYHISSKDSKEEWINRIEYRSVNAEHVELLHNYTGKLVYVNNAKKPQARVGYKHFNSLGREIENGQFVVFRHEHNIGFGTVVASKRMTVRIEFAGKTYSINDTDNVIAIDDDDLKQDLMALVLTGEIKSLWNMPRGRTEKFKLD